MKNCFKYLVIFALLLGVGLTSVDAASCPASIKKDISKLANYVKIDYEVEDNSTYKKLKVGDNETEYKIPNYTFSFSIYNIAPELFITLEDKSNGMSMNITHDMTDNGTYTFKSDDFGSIHNYTLTVKSANDQCYGARFRTIKQTQPRYNAYSEFAYCKNSSSYYCQRFVGTELNLKNTDEFYQKIKPNNKSDKEQKEEGSLIQVVKQNWKLYLGIFAGLIVAFALFTVFMRWWNKRKEVTL